ncbi:MAG: hypothetical protein IJA59_04325 [Clostridia bacterium]|nr:hypothetical protein [Clostridia bacterium]
MLYPQNQSKKLSDQLFKNPTCEYRGTPFWAWNGKMKTETLDEQIDMMKKMGLGGFHMHVRTGMDSPYLDEEFMGYVRFCVEKAKKEKMLAWLYDEDRWPSGTAGGKVTAAHPEYATRALLFTCTPYAPDRPNAPKGSVPTNGRVQKRQENGELLVVYDVQLNSDGTLKSAPRIGENEPATGTKWYVYAESGSDDPWFNDHPYADTLNPKAIEEFIKVTHEAYREQFAEDFDKTIPAIFTDEPQFSAKQSLKFAHDKKDVILPWTGDLPDEYRKLYGDDMLDYLPELFWQLPDGKLSQFRYRFHNLIADRFTSAFCTQIGQWCEDNHISLTGHVMAESTLDKQTRYVGDAMRCYPAFGLPGIDMLCDFHEYNTAKQTQSIVHQDGKAGMMSELYGVTGWDYDFRGYKLQGDWQAALGVTVRVPHLTWMTMKGEAKRDYPACIGYQSPWWEQYALVEDHFSRLNTALTRGKAKVRVGVVHPIESFWLLWGPSEQTAALRQQMDDHFAQLTETLLFGMIDFDFINESCLPRQCTKAANPLQVGEMAYDAVIVCGSRTLRSTTLERLNAFQQAGGQLIFIGDCPDHIDAAPSDAAQDLYQRSQRLSFDPSAIIEALEPLRFIDVRDQEGQRTDTLIHQLRQDGDSQWLFVANGKNPVCKDVENAPVLRYILSGEYRLTEYDTLTGEIRPLPAQYRDGKTIFERTHFMHDSLLLRLENGCSDAPAAAPITLPAAAPETLMRPVDVTLDEPNMLLLDMAEWAMDDGPFQPLEELLRLDNAARARLGIPLRRKYVTQPYMLSPETYTHSLRLRFTIPCEYAVSAPMLALEDPELTEIWLDGVSVPNTVCGWYVDKDIKTVALPLLGIGEHQLEVRVPIGRRTNLECFYLLGDFGVRITGVIKTIVPPVRQLGFGDVVSQNLPFYTGNINYHFDVDTADALTLRVPHYRGGLIQVFCDGKDMGRIAFSPYMMTLSDLTPGKHRITLKLYGVRQNGFAQLHHTLGLYFYQDPDSWRSKNDLWSYEYQFKPFGILKSPEIYK